MRMTSFLVFGKKLNHWDNNFPYNESSNRHLKVSVEFHILLLSSQEHSSNIFMYMCLFMGSHKAQQRAKHTITILSNKWRCAPWNPCEFYPSPRKCSNGMCCPKEHWQCLYSLDNHASFLSFLFLFSPSFKHDCLYQSTVGDEIFSSSSVLFRI